MVHDKITGLTQIGVLDKYLYGVNSTGIYVLKTSTDKATKGYQLLPQQIDIGKINNVQAFTIFKAGAYYVTAVFGTLLMIVSLSFF